MLLHLLKYLKINYTEAERLSARVTDIGGWSNALNHYRIANMAVRFTLLSGVST
jgi:hypothetical protein